MSLLAQNMLLALEYAAIGLGLFVISYISNMCFSIYYNTKILGQSIDKQKIYNSIFKVGTFGVGTVLMTIATVAIPQFATVAGIELPQEYVEVFSTLAISAVFIICSCKYILEAYGKFKKILDQGKLVKEVENGTFEESKDN